VSIAVAASEAGPGFDPTWRFLNKDGVAVGGCSLTAEGPRYYCGPLSAADGPYRVEVFDNSHDATGTYRVRLERLTSPCDDSALPCDQVVSGEIDDPFDADFFSFTAADNERVSIVVGRATTDAGFNPSWHLVTNTGAFASVQCSQTAEGARYYCGPFSAAESPYRVVVFDTGLDATGTYHIALERLTSPCDDSPLPCDQIVSGEIGDSFDADIFSFTALNDQRVNIAVAPTTSGAGYNPSWHLLTKSGAFA
jgi:hypothetical protein